MTHAALKEDWKKVQAELAGAVGDEAFRLFLKNTLIVQLRDDLAEVGVPNLTVADYLEERFSGHILNCIERTLGFRPLAIKFSVNGHLFRRLRESQRETAAVGSHASGNGQSSHAALPGLEDVAVAQTSVAPLPRRGQPPGAPELETSHSRQVFRLNDRFTLDSFVVGAHNKLAFNAAVEIARTPGKAFNPLFIYGGVGLGKTHLLQGVASRLAAVKPTLRTLYVSSEYFVNQYTSAIRMRTVEAFRERFRSLDVLLVDDLGDFVGKPKCQEELLHTLNTLANAGKQVVLSGAVHPKELDGLSDGLRSRFMQGMVAELKEPGFQARVSVIKAKLGTQRSKFPDPTITYLADKLDCNIREMEGYLTQLVVLAGMTGEPLSVSMVQAALDEFLPSRHRTVQLADIENVVIAHFGVTSAELRGKQRHRAIASARQVCMYLARMLTQYSLKEIGRYYGNKNHTTVVFAANKVGKSIEDDPEMRGVVEHLKRLLMNKA